MTMLLNLGIILLVFFGLFFGLAELVLRLTKGDRYSLYRGVFSDLFENFFVLVSFMLLLLITVQIADIKAACEAATFQPPAQTQTGVTE